MKTENLKEGIRLNDLIEKEYEFLANTKNQKCEWIIFTFGNGSNRSNVCDNTTAIEAVRDSLIKYHEGYIRDLQSQFDAL